MCIYIYIVCVDVDIDVEVDIDLIYGCIYRLGPFCGCPDSKSRAIWGLY